MSRGPQRFKQSDLVKAIKAGIQIGLSIRRAIIDPQGKIVVEFGEAQSDPVNDNDWSDV
jgi:hypothetical protein